MATVQQLEEGIRRAAAAEDGDAVRTLGQELLRLRNSPPTAPREMGRGEAAVRNFGQGFLYGANDELNAASAASGLYDEGRRAIPFLPSMEVGGFQLNPEMTAETRDRVMRLPADPISSLIGAARIAMGSEGASESYDAELADQRAALSQANDQFPATSIASNIAGGIAQPLNYLVGAGLKQGAGLAQNMVRGGAAAAPITAAYGFNEGEDGFASRAVNAVKTAAIGAPIAGALGVGVNAIGGVIGRRNAQRQAVQQQDDAVRADFAEFGMTPSRAELTRNADDFAEIDSMSRGGYGPNAQNVANEQLTQRAAQMTDAQRIVQEQLAQGGQGPAPSLFKTPQDAAAYIGDSVDDLAQQTLRRQQTDDAAWQSGVEQATEAGRVGLAGRGRDIARDDVGVGEAVADGVKSAAATAKAGYRSAYDDAFSRDGEFSADFVKGLGQRVKSGLTFSDDPILIDPTTMPGASGAIRVLDDVSNFLRPGNVADPRGMPDPNSITGINLRGIEQARKLLGSSYKLAKSSGNAEDMRAVSRIISGFDNELESAMTSGMFAGDDTALDAIKAARSQFRNYAQTFGIRGAGDDAGANLRKILERDATPNEVANFLYGSARIGSGGGAVRTARRLRDILGPDSDEWLAVRQGAYQRLLEPGADGMTPKTANTIAQRLDDFASGRGRVLAGEMFDDTERATLGKLAGHLRNFAGRDNTPPEALQTLLDVARSRYSPDDLARRITQQAKPGANTVNQRTIMALRDVFGPDSAEVSAVRQLAWQQISSKTEGTTQKGAQAVSSRIMEFLDGSGSNLARTLYTAEQRDLMRRYANVMARTVPPARSVNAPGSGDRVASRMLPRIGEMLSVSLGAATGGATGAVGGLAASTVARGVINARSASKARSAFAGNNPAANSRLGDKLMRGTQALTAAGGAGTGAAVAPQR